MTFIRLFLGELWHTPAAPPLTGEAGLTSVLAGALAVDSNGRIIAAGPARELRPRYPQAEVIDFGRSLLLPGFVDAHTHFPQLDIIGAYGEQLLTWLTTYTYPAEMRLSDHAFAEAAAERYITELLAHGTTLACVYSSSHLAATEILFAAAERRGIRAIIGKTSMDRGAPAPLLMDTAADKAANVHLIKKWHGRAGRLFVALTPRFALSCSPELLSSLGSLKKAHPELYIQSHHAETRAEIAAVKQIYGEDPTYLHTYGRFGLLGERTVMGHAVHADDAEVALYKQSGTRVAHCPLSNSFLGSGLFPLARFEQAGVKVALGTDIGAGTSFSLLGTMAEAYKVQQLRGETVSPAHLLYLATLGGAEALHLESKVGCFTAGKQADFQVLDWSRSRLLAARFNANATAFERLCALTFLGDDRLVTKVFIGGREVYARATS